VLLDRAFHRALRNFSTLFLTVAVLTLTLHLVYSVLFRDVIALSELHLEISSLRPNVKLQGVGPKDVSTSETFFWALTALEILAIPLLIAGAHRVIQVDEGGGVPTVPDAYSHVGEVRSRFSLRFGRSEWITVLIGAAIALLIGSLFERAGLLLTEILPDDWLFLGAGLVRGLSRAVAAPFFLAMVVTAGEAVPAGGSTP
jgi:hypothetical protein